MSASTLDLIKVLLPIASEIIRKHYADKKRLPTDAEIWQEFHANISKYLAEGQQWLLEHPEVPDGNPHI